MGVIKLGTALLFAILAVIPASSQEIKISADDLINRHVKSIGKSTDSVDAIRLFQGKVVFSETIGRTLHLEGTSSVIAQAKRFKCSFQFAAKQYPGEQIVFDGQKVIVGMLDVSSRSNLGAFLHTQTSILEEGLFGGVLSGGWPLLALEQTGARLKYKGIRKTDGRELYDLVYTPKKSGTGELSIRLYFEPGTFRHVMTTYILRVHDSIVSGQAKGDETIHTLEERFDDFRESNGLMLPWHWTIRYRVTPQIKAREYQWESRFADFRILSN